MLHSFKGGRGRAGAGRRGKTGYRYIIYLHIGGRGRAGAGRRGKTVSLRYVICIYMLISEEGAVREPVGGGRRRTLHFSCKL